jgi:hypothetical protein
VELEMQQNVPFDHLTDPMTRKKGVSMLVVEIITIFCSSSAKSDLLPLADVKDRGDDEPRMRFRKLMTA